MIAYSIMPTLALFDIMGGSELLVIFLLVLVFFGGEKMPEFARGFGKILREFRKAASGVEQEFRKALEEDPAASKPAAPTIMPSPPPTARSPNDPNFGAPAVAPTPPPPAPPADAASTPAAPVSTEAAPVASAPSSTVTAKPPSSSGELDAG